MYDDLATSVDHQFDHARHDLERMVRIPSVSAADFDPNNVRMSAEFTAELLEAAGFHGVRLMEVDGAHPAVFGEIAAPPGAPTVLLYAHHDVQPPGPDELWATPPFEPVERNGRLYGRGSSDDKAGIVVHAGAVRAHHGSLPVGVKVIVEGEEEIGSLHLEQFLTTFGDDLAADAIVITDSENWRVGQPAFTTSLRGLVDCVIEVRTLAAGVHSGQFGGAVPNALTVLIRTLATLHDDRGRVAIPGLGGYESDPLDLTEEELREQAGMLDGVELIGEGNLTSRMWTMPAVTVLAIDAPPVARAINQLLPSARAKVSLRIPPGVAPDAAMTALISHLRANVPWGAHVTITPGSSGAPFALRTEGPGYNAFRTGFQEAWERAPVEIGVGGSIPFVDAFAKAYPEADILLTGVADPSSAAHGPNESVHLDELRRGILAEAIALAELGRLA